MDSSCLRSSRITRSREGDQGTADAGRGTPISTERLRSGPASCERRSGEARCPFGQFSITPVTIQLADRVAIRGASPRLAARKVTCLVVFRKIAWTGVDSEEPVVLESAARHGVSEDDALHAWAFAIDAYNVGEGMVMYIGPDRSGALLEVGVVEWHEVVAIVHAMPARPQFQR
jgi:hypothetical protein